MCSPRDRVNPLPIEENALWGDRPSTGRTFRSIDNCLSSNKEELSAANASRILNRFFSRLFRPVGTIITRRLGTTTEPPLPMGASKGLSN
jgi:hypothetical protein